MSDGCLPSCLMRSLATASSSTTLMRLLFNCMSKVAMTSRLNCGKLDCLLHCTPAQANSFAVMLALQRDVKSPSLQPRLQVNQLIATPSTDLQQVPLRVLQDRRHAFRFDVAAAAGAIAGCTRAVAAAVVVIVWRAA